MRFYGKSILLFSFYIIPLLLVIGCGQNRNFFAPLHSDGIESNASVLVADGKAALERGDYGSAETYFGLAKLHNPKNSEARIGYAEAYLKSHGFSLGTFVVRLLDQLNDQSAGQTFAFIQPADWGQANLADLNDIFQTVIDCLDPIALGLTEGPVSSLDIDVNLTTGMFYILSFGLELETLSTQYEVVTLPKSEVQASLPTVPSTVWDQLPDEFLWFKDITSSDLPTLADITQFKTDINNGLARLRVAASQSSSPDMLNQVIDLFNNWEQLANQ